MRDAAFVGRPSQKGGQAFMFQPGDLVVYGSTGVCRVEELTQPAARGTDRKKLF